jgi:hypothetical protein
MLTNKQLKDKILDLFGTPEKLGLQIVDHSTGETEEEYYKDESKKPRSFEGVEVLPDGEPNAFCFNSANYAIKQMGEGALYGFYTEDNPSVTNDEVLSAGGHNFAVFRNRFIVDLWITHYTGSTDKIIYDLKDPRDHAEIKAIFGDTEKWEYCEDLLPGEKMEDKIIKMPEVEQQKSPEMTM